MFVIMIDGVWERCIENLVAFRAAGSMWRPRGLVLLAVIAFAVAGCGEKQWNGADSDVGMDVILDDMEIDRDIEPSEVDGEQGPEQPVDSIEEDILRDEEEEEMVGPGCGNGIIEGPEVCDDGNGATEFCGRWDDCLGDCSLLQASCGNGRLDPGEECDDGNPDDLDDCTTSCNINDHGIGAPCQCENCYGINVTTGPIYGCEGIVIPPGSGGELACVHTLVEGYSGYKFYAPGGYCSIYALRCIGDEIDCAEVQDVGDITTFSCPPGYPYFGVSCQATGGVGIVLKACLRPCDSPAQCRWNAFDENFNECGRMDCIAHERDPLFHVCLDARNFIINLPDIDCELL
jgi:cysteine-rich repeat protein